ncbi:non-ribosomal peptide synthase domain TIGR01720, partial [Thermoactinomyces sp. DSM 45891]|uniref:condensation domain-containing protein n=1 Tax=Thermoactinomyces sp. DSM 45891 TaxID=1761907 RepID=UPI00090EF091
YVVGDADVTTWRDYLKTELPSHMIPTGFVKMDLIPLTTNGKVDRKALPMPEGQKIEKEWVAPRSLNEEVLANIWKQVLGIKQVGIHDNFFEIGGDSILSIQIISRASQMGLKLTPKQMFESPTIFELAQVAGKVDGVVAEQGVVTGEAPLTPIQQWFFEQEHPNPHHWNQSMLLRVRETLDVELLEKALLYLLTHHDALRFRYEPLSDGTWKQRNKEIDEQSVLRVIKRNDADQQTWNQVIQEEMDTAQASIDLHTGPLMRVVYFGDGPDEDDRLFWLIHHLVVDGVSWRILLEDLQNIYSQMKHGNRGKIKLPAKSTSFKEWSERLQTYGKSGISKEVQDYWHEQLTKPVMTISMESQVTETTEASLDQVTVVLGTDETYSLLQEVPATYKTQINEVLLTALVLASTNYTDQNNKLSVHLEGHGREELIEDVELTRTVGWFTSIYPVHFDLQGATTPIEGLKAVKEQLRRIPNHGVDYGIYRYLSSHKHLFNQQSKPSISFNYLGQLDQIFSSGSLFMHDTEFTSLDHAPQSKPSHPIEVIGMVQDEKLHLVWRYSREQFSRFTIQSIAESMLNQLRLLIKSPTTESAFTVSDFADAEALTEESLSKVLLKLSKK